MSQYTAECLWQRRGSESPEDFAHQRYSRAHELRFDGGAVLPASSAVSSVKLPWSDPAGVDPEEMLVASLSSCHMLWFLSLAAQAGFVVDRYHDAAVGTMARNAQGKLVITEVVLRPQVSFARDKQPGAEALAALHHHAHEECFIANSVRSEVRVEPR